jgi:hypothetical protein
MILAPTAVFEIVKWCEALAQRVRAAFWIGSEVIGTKAIANCEIRHRDQVGSGLGPPLLICHSVPKAVEFENLTDCTAADG